MNTFSLCDKFDKRQMQIGEAIFDKILQLCNESNIKCEFENSTSAAIFINIGINYRCIILYNDDLDSYIIRFYKRFKKGKIDFSTQKSDSLIDYKGTKISDFIKFAEHFFDENIQKAKLK